MASLVFNVLFLVRCHQTIHYTWKVQQKSKKKILRKIQLVMDLSIFFSHVFHFKTLCSRSFIDFQIWDFPGQVDFFDEMAYDPQEIFGTVGALIFVIDAQDDYNDALHRLFTTVTSAYAVNPSITFEVLIHKVDGLSDDYKIGKKKNIYTILKKRK